MAAVPIQNSQYRVLNTISVKYISDGQRISSELIPGTIFTVTGSVYIDGHGTPVVPAVGQLARTEREFIIHHDDFTSNFVQKINGGGRRKSRRRNRKARKSRRSRR